MKKEFRSGCPVSSSLDVVGDKWSLLIIRDMLVKHKKTFKQMSDSYEKIAPSILSARLKLLESYKLIFKTKAPENKKENIYLIQIMKKRILTSFSPDTIWFLYNIVEIKTAQKKL